MSCVLKIIKILSLSAVEIIYKTLDIYRTMFLFSIMTQYNQLCSQVQTLIYICTYSYILLCVKYSLPLCLERNYIMIISSFSKHEVFIKNNWKYFAHDFKYFATILSVCVHITFTIDTKQEQSKKDHILIKVFNKLFICGY